MNDPQESKPFLRRLVDFLKELLRLDAGQALVMLVQVIKALKSVMVSQRHGIYEVLSHDSTVELLDTNGQEVVVTRLEEVRFLRGNTIAFHDTYWARFCPFLHYG